jgi:hypothetical protein
LALTAGSTTTISLSSILSGLSYALDLTEGHPRGHASRSCLIGMRLAVVLGLSADERTDLFYALLLKDAGCSERGKGLWAVAVDAAEQVLN